MKKSALPKTLLAQIRTNGFNTVVNALSNNERNHWARAGYPGLQRKDPSGPAAFCTTPQKLVKRLKELGA